MKLIKKVSLVALLILSIGSFVFFATEHPTQTTNASTTTTIIDPGTGGPGSG